MNAANMAASQIKFADETVNPTAYSGETQRNVNLNININRAQVNADDLINDINRVLKSQGSTVELR